MTNEAIEKLSEEDAKLVNELFRETAKNSLRHFITTETIDDKKGDQPKWTVSSQV